MQITYHMGAHCTDEDRLFRCLLKNKTLLARDNIVVTGPGRFRPVLRDSLNRLQGERASQDLQDTILGAVMDVERADRLVFANEQFVCSARAALKDNRLYGDAGLKSVWIRNLFPEAQAEFFMGIRNPATFVPALFNRLEVEDDFVGFLTGVIPPELRWSDTIASIRSNSPDAPLTVWCNEDTPLIWPDILAALAGYEKPVDLKGTNDFLLTIMNEEGVKRLDAYLADHPPKSRDQRIRVVSAFLDKYANPDEIEMEMDLPGWTEDLVAQMTTIYEEDCARIAEMPGVTFIQP